MRNNVIGTMETFNNVSPAGQLILSKHSITLQPAPEVVTRVEADIDDVLTAAVLQI